jgi:hypothetical protein
MLLSPSSKNSILYRAANSVGSCSRLYSLFTSVPTPLASFLTNRPDTVLTIHALGVGGLRDEGGGSHQLFSASISCRKLVSPQFVDVSHFAQTPGGQVCHWCCLVSRSFMSRSWSMSRARPPTRVGIKEAPVCIVAGAFHLARLLSTKCSILCRHRLANAKLAASSVVGPRWEAGLGRYL